MNGVKLKYRTMLLKISEEIVNREFHGIDMLKFAYSDFASIKTVLQNAKSPFELFEILDNKGILKQTDRPTILFETIELLGLMYLKVILEEYGYHCQENPRITLFSSYRQRIIRFANSLVQADIENIGHLFSVPRQKRCNQWLLLQYLEDKCDLSEKTVAQFIKTCLGIGVNIDALHQPIQETLNAAAVQDDQHGSGYETPPWFKELLAKVTQWYDTTRVNIDKVKVLLKDILKDQCNVKSIKDFSEVFEKLYQANKLHPTNLTILYEIIKSTGQLGLEREVKEIVPSCPNIRGIEVVEISEYRLKLIKFGNALGEDDWNTIDGVYNFPRKRYSDAWCMIIHLEEKGTISENDLTTFIEKLVRQKVLNHAVEALR